MADSESLISTLDYNVTSGVNYTDYDSPMPIYGQALFVFKGYYWFVHGYLAIVVCIFGTIANILNIIVLTRKNMVSATNSILTGLAVADMLVMIDYVPFALHTYVIESRDRSIQFSYTWAMLTLFHAHISVTAHAISTYLTVALAIWRYLSVKFPTQSRNWLTMKASYLTIIGTYIAVPLSCIPVYLSFMIVESQDETGIYYTIDFSNIALTWKNELLKKINFWVFSVGYKLVPCVLLTFLSRALINLLHKADERKRRLKSNSIPLKVPSSKCNEQQDPKRNSVQDNIAQQQQQQSRKSSNESNSLKNNIPVTRIISPDGISIISPSRLPPSSSSSKDVIKPVIDDGISKINDGISCDDDEGGGHEYHQINLSTTASGCPVAESTIVKSLPPLLNPSTHRKAVIGTSNDVPPPPSSPSTAPIKIIPDDKLSSYPDAVKSDRSLTPLIPTRKVSSEGGTSNTSSGHTVHFDIGQISPGERRRPSCTNDSNRGTLSTSGHRPSSVQPSGTSIQSSPSSSSTQSDRTTRMLLAVLFLFLITESPTGLIALCCGVFGENWFKFVFTPLGELFDMLALINSAINFILYCTMSTAFRNTFSTLFFSRSMIGDTTTGGPTAITRA